MSPVSWREGSMIQEELGELSTSMEDQLSVLNGEVQNLKSILKL